MGHTERIIAELATLDEAQQASLLAFVERLKAERSAAAGTEADAAHREARAALSAALAPYRVSLAGYRFDRDEANAR